MIDNRRHVDIQMSKLDRKVKVDKAIAIDQHHQKAKEFRLHRPVCMQWRSCTDASVAYRAMMTSQITQIDEMIEDVIDVLYDYEEQLEG